MNVSKRAVFVVVLLILSLGANGFAKNSPKEYQSLYNQGREYFQRGLYEKALDYYEKGLEMARKAKNEKAQLAFHESIAMCLKKLGQYNKAIKHFRKALKLSKKLEIEYFQTFNLSELGGLYAKLKAYNKAIELHEKGLAISRKINDAETTFGHLAGIAYAYLDSGRTEEAVGYFSEALIFSRKIKDENKEMAVYGSLGGVYLKQGKPAKARDYYKKALETAKSIGAVKEYSHYVGALGLVYQNEMKYKKAFGLYEKALKLSLETGDYKYISIRLVSLGSLYLTVHQYDKALRIYGRLLKLARKNKKEGDEMFALDKMAFAYMGQGKYKKAMESLENALKLDKKEKHLRIRSDILERMGMLHFRMGEYEKAESAYGSALSAAKRTSDPSLTAFRYYGLALFYHGLSRFSEAKKYYRKSKEYAHKSGDDDLLRMIERSEVEILLSSGKFADFMKYAKGRLAQVKEQGDENEIMGVLLSLGLMYHHFGDHEGSLYYYKRAYDIAEKLKKYETLAEICLAMGDLSLKLRDYPGAVENYEKMIYYTGKARNPRMEIIGVSKMGDAYRFRAQAFAVLHPKGYSDYLEKALSEYEKAARLASEIGDEGLKATMFNSIGVMLIRLGKIDAGLKYLDRVVRYGRRSGDAGAMHVALLYRSEAYFKKGDYKNAVITAREALKTVDDRNNSSTAHRIRFNLSLAYYADKQYDKALTVVEPVIDDVERVYENVGMRDVKSHFHEKFRFVYDIAVELLLKKGRTAKAFEYVERGKARAFLQSMVGREIRPDEKNPLIVREKELLEKIRNVSIRISRTDENEAAGLKKLQLKYYREYRGLLEKIKLNNPGYASLRSVSVSSVDEIRRMLKKDEALIEYYTGAFGVYAWVLTADGISMKRLKVNRDEIRLMTSSLRSRLEMDSLSSSGSNESALKVLGVFHRELLKPLLSLVDGKKTLVIVPHRDLHYVPFCAFRDEKGRYLVENYTIIEEPSASAFVLFRKRKGSDSKKLAAFALGGAVGGDAGSMGRKGERTRSNLPSFYRTGMTPLPGTTEEVGRICGFFTRSGIKAECFEEEAFTTGRTVRQVKDAGYIHFATHGLLSGKAGGLFSGLVTSDGLIFIADIFNWKLNARLVVLSACKTGLGNVSNGDDMVSFTRAFLSAGCDNIVTTLWSVPDQSTRELMVEFYREILDGVSPDNALRHAQLKMIKRKAPPSEWAGFVIYGK